MRSSYLLVRSANLLRRRIRASEIWFLLAALAVGIVAGLGTIALNLAAHGAQRLLYGLEPEARLSASGHVAAASLIALPIGGALLGVMIWFRRRRTPIDVVEANALHGGRIPAGDSVTVVAQTLISNGFGASVGLEAAYAQAGGGLASVLGQALKLRRNDLRTLVGAGTAAAISAAFGAPLAGAFYAFEIVLGAYSPATIAPVAIASLAAAVTARSLGVTPYVISAGSTHPVATAEYLLYALLGLVCAGLGIAFMQAVTLLEQRVRRSGLPPYLSPAVGGFLLIPLALVSPVVLSGGHGALSLTLMTQLSVGALFLTLVLKMTASAVSLGFGFRGGLFFASLFLGALIGQLFQLTAAAIPNLHPLAANDAALVGLAAFAVAVVGGPMTMSLLVLEVTHDFAITGVAITAALISSTVVRERFGYSFSTWRLHLRGETIRSGRDIGWVRTLTAGRMMRRDVPVLPAATSVKAFRDSYPLGSATRVVVTDGGGNYAGIVQTATAYSADLAEETPVGKLAACPTALHADMDIEQVMEAFDREQVDDLAVIAPGGAVLGAITEKHVRKRYSEELEKTQREFFGEE